MYDNVCKKMQSLDSNILFGGVSGLFYGNDVNLAFYFLSGLDEQKKDTIINSLVKYHEAGT